MEPLNPGRFYHIFNHANGKENLFIEEKNYNYFLMKFEKYVAPFVYTNAYCLMPNHFHLMVQIKTEKEVLKSLDGTTAITKYRKLETAAEKTAFVSNFVSKQFANLFSSYTQGFNKVYQRKGSLFLKNFKRKGLDREDYFSNLILYIHLNPVKHGFVERPEDWGFSSFNTFLSSEKTFLQREEVIGRFDDVENFKYSHVEAAKNKLFQSSELWKSWELESE